MAGMERHKASPSSALYALLLNLYPRKYLHEHGQKMLQNFEDLERASSSRPALWLFIGRDFLVSLMEEHMKALHTLPVYVVGVLLVWAAIFVVGYYEKGETPEHPMLHVFGGFVLGILSMYIAMRVYPSRRKDSNS
ncbi:MAG: hypothetical protein JO071_14270 [Deltaproteobacteria bacterium]|nr:hypothetical protein [Deltaproteobacteria bacterium]